MQARAERPSGKRDMPTGTRGKGSAGWFAGLGVLAASGVAYLIHRALLPKSRTTGNMASGDGNSDALSDSSDGGGD